MPDLLQLIKQRIDKFGPMSVADYMSMCLTHPEHGYYMKRDPLGAKGDFTTSPEISQIFGELLGLWLAAQWQKQGKSDAIVVELGPGRGTLAADLLRATKKVAGFHDNISLHLIEMSPALRQKQWQMLAGKHAQIHWHETLDELPEKPIFFIANEFFDALPIHQYVNGVERMVACKNNQLVFTPQETDNIIESSPASIEVMKKLSSHIAQFGGAGLVIDYGYTVGSKGDTLQAMKNHTYHSILENPGEADITAHVDFAALKDCALEAGASCFGAMPQGKFLLQIGASQRLMTLSQNAQAEQRPELLSGFERLISHEQMGELFKVMAVLPADAPKPEGF